MAGMTLQQAIDYAAAPPPETLEYGIEVLATISMHDDDGTVMVGSPEYPAFTFRPNLPLLNWGPATISPGGLLGTVNRVAGRHWFTPTQVPGFSTRGQGGLTFRVATGDVVPLPTDLKIDLSVRRSPGLPYLGSPHLSPLGSGPSVQIQIDTLSAAGAATDGVTLDAVEDGALVRAVGPSVRDHTSNASYTFTIFVMPHLG